MSRVGMASACVLVGLLSPSVARATYSIAATDSGSGMVGGAVTSCVGSLDLSVVFGGVPGHGVVHAQASLDGTLKGKKQAMTSLGLDVPPAMIIAQIATGTFDTGYASRQYGIVDLAGRSAGFTGARASVYKEDRQGQTGTFTYSIQGNLLTSVRVIDQAESGFRAAECDLAGRLMAALEAGAGNGEGDNRCTGRGIPADSAFIEVDEAGSPAGSYLRISVTGTGAISAVKQLRARFDAWRTMHPCAAPPDMATPSPDLALPTAPPDLAAAHADTDGGAAAPTQSSSSCAVTPGHRSGDGAAGLVLASLVMLAVRRRRSAATR